MEDSDREHSLIEHVLSLIILLQERHISLKQFLAGNEELDLPVSSQEARFAREVIQFMDEMPGGFLIYRADSDEEIIYANQGLLRIVQCETLSEFRRHTGNSFRGLVHPADLEAVEASIRQQISASQYDLDYVEYRITRLDGEIRWIEDYGHFVRSSSVGDVFYVFLGDATEKRNRSLLERALLLSEKQQMRQENLRRMEVIEGLSVNYESIFYADLDKDQILPYRLSDRTRAQFDEKLQSRRFSWYAADYAATWVHPEDREMISREMSPAHIRERLAQESSYYVNYRVLCQGEAQYLQLRFVNVGEGERVSQIVMGYRRVDEEIRRELEQKQLLSQALENANLAIRAKNTFLSNMSHDMRTPLNAIFGFTALARRNLHSSEKVHSYLDQVDAASRQLLHLIDEVLEATWTGSNESRMSESPCSLRAAIQEVCDFLLPQAEEKGIEFTVDLSQVFHDEIFSDQDKLGKLVMYLANNAVTYTKPGGKVSVTAAEQGELPDGRGVYLLTVKDTGAGISKAFLDRIFEPFAREQNTTLSGVHGIGLGLTIAKNIVDRMDGTLDVQSEPGRGSTFTATLHFRRQPQRSPLDGGEACAGAGRGRRLLLVEDNEINLEIETELLEGCGFAVDTAVNGLIALEKVRSSEPGRYDLILMDIQMPVMDGWQAAEAIRALEDPALSGIPIIALSANVFQSDAQRSIRCGMEAHLTKPVDMPLLLKTIEKITARCDAAEET